MINRSLASLIPDVTLPEGEGLKRGDKLVIASHNRGKVKEIQVLLEPFGLEILCAGDLGLPEPVEDAETFVGNALIKARATAKAAGLPALADDSGLCVYALGGDPGVYSARWAGESKDFQVAMQRVHDALGESVDRTGFFIAVLALAFPDGREATFTGTLEGTLSWPPRGRFGFGYDPMFIPEGETQGRTVGEMTPEEKKDISHRTRAFAKFLNSGVLG